MFPLQKKKVRVGYLFADRIGHFVFDFVWYLECVQDRSAYTDLFFYVGKPANAAFDRIVRRNLRVWCGARDVYFWFDLFPKLRESRTLHPARVLNHSRDPMNVLANGRRFRSLFSEKENEYAHAVLRKYGMQAGDQFVCLVVRDAGYLSQAMDGCPERWRYHDYRNSDIGDYEKGVLHLVDRGYFVFRMGRYVQQALKIDRKEVIDYASMNDPCDLMDIWLFANCKFTITTGTGIDTVSLCAGTPMLFLNFLPLHHAWSWHKTLTVPKPLYWKKQGRKLSLSDYLRYCFQNTNDYVENQICIGSLSPDEIVSTFVEFDQRVSGEWVESKSEKLAQDEIWNAIKARNDQIIEHEIINPQAKFGSVFIEFIEGEN